MGKGFEKHPVRVSLPFENRHVCRPFRRAWLRLFFCACACACAREADSSPVTARVSEVGNVVVLQLSRSLNALATSRAKVDTLSPEVVVDGAKLGIRNIADIAPLGDGNFAVLDREARSIRIFDSSGAPHGVLDSTSVFREHPLLRPLAMAHVGESLVVWDVDSAATFQVVRLRDHRVVALAGRATKGDWSMMEWREPYLQWEGRFQQSPEDAWRRLYATSDSTFVHYLQPSERDAKARRDTFDWSAPRAQLIEYNLSGRVRDTAATLVGPVTFDGGSGYELRFIQPLFEPRPMWATGDDWIALADRDSSALRVVDARSRRVELVVRWPADTLQLTNRQKLEAARERLYYVKAFSSEMRREFAEASGRAIQAAERNELRQTEVAATVPTISAVFSNSHCVWLAGFSATDELNGASHTLIGISVPNHRIAGAVRITGRARLLRADDEYLYASEVTPSGAWQVVRYRLPGGAYGCGRTPGHPTTAAANGGVQ